MCSREKEREREKREKEVVTGGGLCSVVIKAEDGLKRLRDL